MEEKGCLTSYKTVLCALCALWGALKTVFYILYPNEFAKWYCVTPLHRQL